MKYQIIVDGVIESFVYDSTAVKTPKDVMDHVTSVVMFMGEFLLNKLNGRTYIITPAHLEQGMVKAVVF